jgi:Cu2+-exporting ATPase
MRQTYDVTGMTCASCQSHVERAVGAVPGVESVAVSLLTNSMSVEGTASAAAVERAVSDAGYGATPRGGQTSGDSLAAEEEALVDHETPRLRRRLVASLGFLLALMYLSMGHMMWGWPLPAFFDGNHVAMGIVEMLLAGIIMVINRRFFVSGLKGLAHRAPNMDTLVAMGSGVSYAWSVWALLQMTYAQVHDGSMAAMAWMDELYFESAAMILVLITVGKMLEAMSKGRTTDALRGLMRLAPKTANVLRDGHEVEVGVEGVAVGDLFVVRPGGSIPVDGEVVEGGGAVDESALTGESVPVDKGPGDAVSAATINRSGLLTCRATRVGADTALAQVIRMVSDAAATKAPIAKVADEVSGVFVPAVLGVAAAVALVWLAVGADPGYALARGISVLVISCPCALGLATPVAIMVGNGMGAKAGILFKTAASLEATGRVRIVALDKTGTITSGAPVVTDVLPAAGVGEEDLLATAAALEAGSEHPLARAVLDEARSRGVGIDPVEGFSALPGSGLVATLRGRGLVGGNLELLARHAQIPGDLRSRAESLAGQGRTPLWFAAGGRALGVIAVADAIKPDSASAVAQLKAQGLRVVMLTGDNERTARAIGSQAGVDRVVAGVRPDGKEAVVRRLQDLGPVAMVGDGINDAPALARADVGIAIGAGTDVAIDAADVVLVNSHLADVPAAVRLSRATIRNIHENLFWAFFYNVICIPVAAGAWVRLTGWTMSPMLGAAAMSLSSLFVVTNALRLNLFDLRGEGHDRHGDPVGDGELDEALVELAACPARNVDNAPTGAEGKGTTMEKSLKVEGMMCQHCVAHVTKALEGVEGVSDVHVSLDDASATLEADAQVTDDELLAAVKDAGYRASVA